MFKQTLAIVITLAVSLAIAPAQADTANATSTIERIPFKAPSEGYLLDGYMVRDHTIRQKQPAIIFLVGSGTGSTLKNYQSTTEFFFDHNLVEQGFTMVYFDKRGLGDSEGVWYSTSFEQRALDARNVALHLREYDFIDHEQVFVVGHSQGGWIVQIALAEYPEVFAGGISMAGPTFGVRRQMINDAASILQCKQGLSQQEAERKASRQVSRNLFFISLVGWKGNLRQLNLIKDFEPDAYLKAIHQPFFMMFGENDPLVSPAWSLQALDRLFPDQLPDNISYYVAAGEEHSFKRAPSCYQGSWRELSFSTQSRDQIRQWLEANTQPH